MPCYYSLYKAIDATDNTGSWYAVTSISNLKHTSDDVDPDTLPGALFSTSSYTANQLITTNPYLWIDPSTLSTGEYKLKYVVTSGSASSTSTFTINVGAKVNTGTAVSGLELCACNDNNLKLSTLILSGEVDSDGFWSGTGVNNFGYSNNGTLFNGLDDTFNPSLAGVAPDETKTLTFTYSIDRGYDCDDCKSSTTVSVDVLGSALCSDMFYEAAYYLDNPGNRVSSDARQTWKINSVKIDNIQYVSTPINLCPTGDWQSISTCSCYCPYGDVNYVDDIPDALNALNLPGFVFVKVCVTPLTPCHSSSTGGWDYTQVVNKYVYVSAPSCSKWEIEFEWIGGKTRWTNSSNEKWDGVKWIPNNNYDITYCGLPGPIVEHILTNDQVTP